LAVVTSGYHKVICLNSECKPLIIHIMSLLVILSTYVMEDGQTGHISATSSHSVLDEEVSADTAKDVESALEVQNPRTKKRKEQS